MIVDEVPAERPLARWEWIAVAAIPILLIAFGHITLRRATHHEGGMTDLGVYARAAWAMRVGLNPYDIAGDRGWHYLYPPTFVVAMFPFADPPDDVARPGCLPFSVTVVAWYAINCVLAGVAVHLFALAAMPGAKPGSRRWWYLRLIPFDVAITSLGYTLSRGQVNILVLAVLGACFLHWSRKQSFRAGLWLALAAAIKVLPGLLLLLVLVRRNGRMVLGLAVGLFVSLGIVPAMVWGIDGAIDMNRTFLSRVAGPSVTNGGDATIHKEFSGTTSTDSQAFHAIIHAWRHPDRDARPDVSDGISKGLHYAIGLALLAMVLFAAWKQRMELDDPVRLLLAFGSICVVMVHIAPASHMHYYSYSLPLIAGLLFENLRWHPTRAVPTRPVLLGFAAWFTGTLLPLIDTDPSFVALRDRGLAVAANLGLLAWGVARLLRAKKV